MANEITLTVQVTCSSSNYTPGTISLTNQITQTAVGGSQNVQTINTTVAEAITKGDAIQGILYMRNLNGTNYINWGSSTGLYCKLKAGEQSVVRVSSGKTLYAQANTGPCNLFTWWINN